MFDNLNIKLKYIYSGIIPKNNLDSFLVIKNYINNVYEHIMRENVNKFLYDIAVFEIL